MRDPEELYELATDLPDLDRPVMIHKLSGYVDAGSGGRLAVEHLLSQADPQVVAAFDLDELLDYRSRRPTMTFAEDHWESYHQDRLLLQVLHDADGTPYLLLHGPEPDLQWERFIAAVSSLVARLDVRLTLGMNAIPMGVPHTRPTGITAHATRADLVSGYEPWLQRVQVPASVGNLLELRLGEQGQDAAGFAVHVPHYLAQNDYPAAAEALLDSLAKLSGLALPTDALREAAEKMRETVDEQVAKSSEVSSHVHGLEQQYDALVQSRQSQSLLADLTELPTADELGAELERFLAEQSKPDNPPGSS